MYREQLISIYLDYINNYLSIAKFAEHNGLYEHQAMDLLDLAKNVYNSNHPEA